MLHPSHRLVAVALVCALTHGVPSALVHAIMCALRSFALTPSAPLLVLSTLYLLPVTLFLVICLLISAEWRGDGTLIARGRLAPRRASETNTTGALAPVSLGFDPRAERIRQMSTGQRPSFGARGQSRPKPQVLATTHLRSHLATPRKHEAAEHLPGTQNRDGGHCSHYRMH